MRNWTLSNKDTSEYASYPKAILRVNYSGHHPSNTEESRSRAISAATNLNCEVQIDYQQQNPDIR